MKAFGIALSMTLGLAATATVAAPPTQDVNIANTPLPVTVENPQTSVTVDNTTANPLPVDVQNPQTSVTIDNSGINPVPVTVQNQSTPSQTQFVGFSSATFDGRQGVVTYTDACEQSFSGSYMCTSEEFLNTKTFPVVSGSGWIRSTHAPIAIASAQAGTRLAGQDISGVVWQSDSASGGPIGMTCAGWSSNSSLNVGLTVDSDGRFSTRGCDQTFAVACCQ